MNNLMKNLINEQKIKKLTSMDNILEWFNEVKNWILRRWRDNENIIWFETSIFYTIILTLEYEDLIISRDYYFRGCIGGLVSETTGEECSKPWFGRVLTLCVRFEQKQQSYLL